MSIGYFLGSVELGLIYAIMALGVFLSFRTLNTPDLTVDGSFVLGAACSAVIISGGGNAYVAVLVAFAAGCLAGSVTSLLATKLKIQPLLAGILVMLGLYSVNLMVMGGKANIPLMNVTTVFQALDPVLGETALAPRAPLFIALIIILLIQILFYLFLGTRLGLALRATGDNEYMVRASGIDSDLTKLIGLAISNGMVAVSGTLIAQYQSYADVGMGIGMVVIGLASVIIGEVVFGIRTLFRRLTAVVLGSILYRLIIAVALMLGLPATALRLVSAIIVTIALSTGVLGSHFKKLSRRITLVQTDDKGGQA